MSNNNQQFHLSQFLTVAGEKDIIIDPRIPSVTHNTLLCSTYLQNLVSLSHPSVDLHSDSVRVHCGFLEISQSQVTYHFFAVKLINSVHSSSSIVWAFRT